jgi:hypothetical protein
MIPFTDPIKIYVFKNIDKVKISFMLSEHCVMDRWMTLSEFDTIMCNWKQGVEGMETSMGRVWWSHRPFGPRPAQEPADFVAVSFAEWNFRLTTAAMIELEKEYHRQCNTINHWD